MVILVYFKGVLCPFICTFTFGFGKNATPLGECTDIPDSFEFCFAANWSSRFSCVDSGWRIFYFKGDFMENELYIKMYYHLFNAVTDAIRSKNKEISDQILKQAQIDVEEIYISEEPNHG